MADPFGVNGSGSKGSDPFNVGGSGGGGKKKKGHGGVVGVLERTGANLYDAAVNTPAGFVALGKGLATDPAGTVEQIVKATAQDLRHPLRNPGYTLLDLWGIASLGAGTAARTAAAGSKIAEGARAGEIARAALTRPKPRPRVFSADNVTVEGEFSRSPLTALMQKTADKVREERLPGRNKKRVGRELDRQERIIGGIERGPASALIAAGKSLPLEQQTALRVVAEGVPVDERIAMHQTDLANATGRTARRLRRKIALVEGARKHVDESSGEPLIAAGNPKLETIYRKLEEVATSREDLLQRIGEIDGETIAARRQAAGRVFKGATGRLGRPSATMKREQRRLFSLDRRLQDALAKEAQFVADRRAAVKETAGRVGGKSLPLDNPYRERIVTLEHALEEQKRLVAQMEKRAANRVRPTGIVGAEDFQGGKVFVTNRPDAGIKASLTRAPQIGANGVVGRGQKLPGMQQFTGESIHQATFGDKTTELVGRSSLEAQKLGALLRLRDAIRPAVKAAPESKHDILVRLDDLGRNKPLPQISRELREKLDLGARLTPDEERQAQGAFEALRARLLPETGPGPLSPEAATELARLFEKGKVGYVDRRLLGGLDKPQPRLENWIGRRGAAVFDATNNASRAAILYLKPAYAVPNMLGNATLIVLRQGWAAPRELTRSLRLSRIGRELAARIDEVMGDGFARALAGDSGIGNRAIQAAANFWGRGVDIPFRRASFLYEARKAGYRTPEQLARLLTDEALRGELVQVSRRANNAIIDYANLSPVERAVIARVVFFYPWVKGSSAYTARFVADHPVETMIAAQIGRMGKAVSDRELGALPSYLDGLIPAGRAANGNPITLNPASAAIFQTPAQAAAGILGTLTGAKSARSQLTNFSTPAVNALIELVTRRTEGGYPIEGGVQNVAYDALIRNLPQVSLARNLRQAVNGDGRNRIYPPSVRTALLQYLIGGIGNPRELNLAAARKQAEAGR